MTTFAIRSGLVLVAAIFSSAAMANHEIDASVGVPPDSLSKTFADTCPALRSGTYRMVSPTLGGTLADQTGKAVLDAAKLAITRPDGGRGTWEAKGNCRFADPGSSGTSVDYVVSQAGVLVGRITVNGGSSYRTVIGFPEQTHALAELAGTWNTMGLRGAAEGFYVDAGSLSYDGTGAATAGTACANPATWAVDVCTEMRGTALQGANPLSEDATGGFTSKSGTRTSRVFLYKAATDYPMIVGIASDGAFFLGTPADGMVMPAVGRTTVSWNLDMTDRLASATGTYVSSATVVAVDFQHGSWTRSKKASGSSDEHFEQMLANTPRSGYLTRPAGEATTSSGSRVRFNEFTNLPIPGMGIFAVVLPAVKLFEIAVRQP